MTMTASNTMSNTERWQRTDRSQAAALVRKTEGASRSWLNSCGCYLDPLEARLRSTQPQLWEF